MDATEQPPRASPPSYPGDQPPEPRWLLYLLSFVVPLVGIILGAIFLSKQDPDCRLFGKNCLICGLALPVAGFVIACLLIGGLLLFKATQLP